MKTTSWLILAAITMILGGTLLVQKNKDGKTESIAATETPSQPRDGSPTGTEESTNVAFTLQTVAEDGKLLFQGVGGEIDGMINPDLNVPAGASVEITLINADGMPHNVFLPDFNAQSSYVAKIGDQTRITFEVRDQQAGSYVYYCEVPGHRQAGQEGKLVVEKDLK